MRRIGLFVFCLVLAASAVRADEVAELRRLLEGSPDRPDLYDRLGLALARQGDLSNAEAAFRKAVKLDRTYGRAWYNLGVLQILRGRYEEALGPLIVAVTMDTNDTAALLNLGNLHNLRNELEMAERHYRRALALVPDDADLLNNAAVVALKRGEAEEAVRLLERAYGLKPDREILYNLLVALRKAGRRERLRELAAGLSGSRHEAELRRLLAEE